MQHKPLTVASDTPNISLLAESTILTPDLLRRVKVENEVMRLGCDSSRLEISQLRDSQVFCCRETSISDSLTMLYTLAWLWSDFEAHILFVVTSGMCQLPFNERC